MEFNSSFYQEFSNIYTARKGYRLADTITPELPTEKLRRIWNSQNEQGIKGALKKGLQNAMTPFNGPGKEEIQSWVDVYAAYFTAVGEIISAREAQGKPSSTTSESELPWTKAYEAWKGLLNTLVRCYRNNAFEAWTLPCLYVVSKNLRAFAIKADEERNNSTSLDMASENFGDDYDPDSHRNQKLEDCARVLTNVFQVCQTDRAPLLESRKWGSYYIINLLLKTHFRLNSVSLSNSILRMLNANKADMPDFSAFPKSQQVTFKYHEGVLAFLEEHYDKAEESLTEAWNLCHKDATRNKELILTYLIPSHLVNTHTLPSEKLLAPFPKLQKLFLPLCRHIKKGELHKFDLALQANEDEFVKRRIYLTLERGRDIALRNLLRKVLVVNGWEQPKEPGGQPVRRTRVPVAEFAAAISVGSQEKIDNDEVECLLANMIYKGLMKGYVSRQHGMVVLSKSGAFPGTGI